MKLIGAGYGRTGTKSLKEALEILGVGPCYHMLEYRNHPEHYKYWQQAAETRQTDWDALFDGFQSCVDWPASHYWRELAEFYPDAKVLLSVRSAESWVKSIQATIFKTLPTFKDMPEGEERDRRVQNYKIIAENTFDERLDDHDFLVKTFNDHIAEVQRTIAPERLLTYDSKRGWEPLCAFLDVPVPDQPYPFTNTTQEFQQRAQARAKEISDAAGG